MVLNRKLPPYSESLAGSLLAAREVTMVLIRPVLRDVGITEQQWRVLRVLCDRGPMDTTSLAEASILLPPSVSRILRELVARELVRRLVDPSDGRRAIVEASSKAHTLVKQTAKHTLGILDSYTNAFGKERIENLINELQTFKSVIEELSDP